MKRCPVCKEWKEASEFGQNKNRYDGLQSICKICRAKMQRSRDRTEILKRYNTSEKGKKTRQKYQSSEKGEAAIEKYRDSDKYRKISREYRKAYRKQYPDRARAHDKVTDAIGSGKLLPANNYQCHFCQNQAAHYHHDDYSKPLEVKPVCPQCHADIHKQPFQ